MVYASDFQVSEDLLLNDPEVSQKEKTQDVRLEEV